MQGLFLPPHYIRCWHSHLKPRRNTASDHSATVMAWSLWNLGFGFHQQISKRSLVTWTFLLKSLGQAVLFTATYEETNQSYVTPLICFFADGGNSQALETTLSRLDTQSPFVSLMFELAFPWAACTTPRDLHLHNWRRVLYQYLRGDRAHNPGLILSFSPFYNSRVTPRSWYPVGQPFNRRLDELKFIGKKSNSPAHWLRG